MCEWCKLHISVKTHWHYFPVAVTTLARVLKKGGNVVMCVKPNIFLGSLTFCYIYLEIIFALIDRHFPHALILTRYGGKSISHVALKALVTDTEMQWRLSGSLSSSHGKLAVDIMTPAQNRNPQKKKSIHALFLVCFVCAVYFPLLSFLDKYLFLLLSSPPLSVFTRRWTVMELGRLIWLILCLQKPH